MTSEEITSLFFGKEQKPKNSGGAGELFGKGAEHCWEKISKHPGIHCQNQFTTFGVQERDQNGADPTDIVC